MRLGFTEQVVVICRPTTESGRRCGRFNPWRQTDAARLIEAIPAADPRYHRATGSQYVNLPHCVSYAGWLKTFVARRRNQHAGGLRYIFGNLLLRFGEVHPIPD